MFGTLGGPELFLILVIALIVFGPRKLPEIGQSMGRMLREFRKASSEFKRTVEDEVEADRRQTTPQIRPPTGAPPIANDEAAAPMTAAAEPAPPVGPAVADASQATPDPTD